MSDKLIELLEQYEKKFEDGFPTMQLMRGNPEEKVVEMIEKCIASNKDAYEIGFLKLEEEVEY